MKVVEEVSVVVEENLQYISRTAARALLILNRRVNRLKAVYDELIPWSLQMQTAVSAMAHRNGFTELRK